MSAPDTNLETQERRHAVPLAGIGLAFAFAALLLVGLIGWIFYNGGTPTGADAQIDGRTGEVVTVTR